MRFSIFVVVFVMVFAGCSEDDDKDPRAKPGEPTRVKKMRVVEDAFCVEKGFVSSLWMRTGRRSSIFICIDERGRFKDFEAPGRMR